MENETKFQVESKLSGTFIPVWLQRWKLEGKDLTLDQVRKLLPKENFHTDLTSLVNQGNSTVLRYSSTPHWGYEKYRRYRAVRESRGLSTADPIDVNCYRITPKLSVDFAEPKRNQPL